MEDKIEKGKRELRILAFIALGIQIAITLTYVNNIGTDKLTGQLIRFLVISILFMFTYTRSKTAKWILVAWYVFNIIWGFNKNEFTTDPILISITLIYLAIPLIILFSKNISSYLNTKKYR